MADTPELCHCCETRRISHDRSIRALDLCELCADSAGLQNEHADTDHGTPSDECPTCLGVGCIHELIQPKPKETTMATATLTRPTIDYHASRLCDCGCGTPVRPGSAFRQGHDQRLRGLLLGQMRNSALHHQKRAAARRALQARGWLPEEPPK